MTNKRKVAAVCTAVALLLSLAWLYTNSLVGVSELSKSYLRDLKAALRNDGLKPRLFVISGRRWQLDNYLLNRFGNAMRDSRHKKGEAIDIIVLDVNNDGKINDHDVDLVYNILNDNIIKDQGGLGSYKSDANFFYRQMIHFDCRGYRARWNH